MTSVQFYKNGKLYHFQDDNKGGELAVKHLLEYKNGIIDKLCLHCSCMYYNKQLDVDHLKNLIK